MNKWKWRTTALTVIVCSHCVCMCECLLVCVSGSPCFYGYVCVWCDCESGMCVININNSSHSKIFSLSLSEQLHDQRWSTINGQTDWLATEPCYWPIMCWIVLISRPALQAIKGNTLSRAPHQCCMPFAWSWTLAAPCHDKEKIHQHKKWLIQACAQSFEPHLHCNPSLPNSSRLPVKLIWETQLHSTQLRVIDCLGLQSQ